MKIDIKTDDLSASIDVRVNYGWFDAYARFGDLEYGDPDDIFTIYDANAIFSIGEDLKKHHINSVTHVHNPAYFEHAVTYNNVLYLHDVFGDDELIFSFNTTALFQDMGAEVKGSWAVDLIFGSEQVDQLFGAGGDDFIEGGAGADTIDGGAGSDRLSGGVGDDIIWGKGANDIIFGDKGSDKLHGGLGADRLSGGAGNDKLYGGAGADTFVFTSYKHSTTTARDMIYDFSQEQGDRIEVSRIDARSATSKNDAFTFIGEKAFSDKPGELRYFHRSGDTFVYGDVNGDGRADFALRLDKTIDLVKGDFIL